MANLRVDKITSTETFETTGSVQFDRVGDYLTTDLGSGLGDNFTIEFWIISNGVAPGSSSPGMFQLSDTSGGLKESTSTLAMYWSTTHGVLGAYHQGESNRVSADPNANNVWKHYAFVRNNGIIKIYRDGKKIYTATSTTDYSSYRYLVIGGYWSTSYLWLGHISNFRIVDGKALYTSNFKPPMRELEVVPGTVVLACQSKTDTILEKTGKTITKFGSTVANELTPGLLTPVPKDGGGSAIKGSVEFNGSTDYLKFPVNTDCTFGTNDFTIEFWLNPGENPTNYTIIFSLTTDTAAKRFEVAYHSNSIRVYTDTATWRDTGIEPLKGEWHHFAFVRNYSGNSLIMYVNGINKWEVTNTRDYDELVNIPRIGSYASGSYGYLQGFLSNFRINKTTALYTDNFIPPTRELKNVPGTVLLCCQDPDNPLTEATGKTITGYGDLHEANNVEHITNGGFVATYSTEWEAKNSANLSHDATNNTLSVTSTTNYSGVRVKSAYLPTLVAGREYAMTIDLASITNPIRFGVVSGNVMDNVSTAGKHTLYFRGTSSTTEIFIEKPSGSNSTFVLKSVSITEAESRNAASNFTPQVGNDRKVTFEGVTKINSNAYFYFPTGDTVTRDSGSGRGLFMGGYKTGPNAALDDIHYVHIPSDGKSQDFGNLTNDARWAGGSCGSSTRGMHGGGATPNPADHIDYVTISTTGDSLDFGNLDTGVGYVKACSNQIRGIWAGGRSSTGPVVSTDVIQYVTIASTGAAKDFGDLQNPRTATANISSPTRAVFTGGYTSPSSTDLNTIEFVTIASQGGAVDFGQLSGASNNYADGVSNGVRGVIGGGSQPIANDIQFFTISSLGNSEDFGDLTEIREHVGSTDNSIRGVFGGGVISSYTNIIDVITISTNGDAKRFGDLAKANWAYTSGTSDSHGGLG